VASGCQADGARCEYIIQYFIQRSFEVSLLLIVPFMLILLAIALLPLVIPHWWEHNPNKALVALILGVPVAGYLLLQGETGWHRVQHTMLSTWTQFFV
jgi:hypothetical protein